MRNAGDVVVWWFAWRAEAKYAQDVDGLSRSSIAQAHNGGLHEGQARMKETPQMEEVAILDCFCSSFLFLSDLSCVFFLFFFFFSGRSFFVRLPPVGGFAWFRA